MKLLSAFVVLLAFVATAAATPIRPDIKKMLDSPRPTMHFVPARASWNGPEDASSQASQAAAIDRFSADARRRGLQHSLLQVAIPDWRIFLGLAMFILLLRALRQRATPVPAVASYPVPVDAIEPIRHRPAA